MALGTEPLAKKFGFLARVKERHVVDFANEGSIVTAGF